MSKHRKNKSVKKPKKVLVRELSKKTWKYGLLVILGLGLLIRLLHIHTVYNSDLKSLHAWSEFDSQFFDDWALKIKDGDLLTDQSLHPYHEWHRAVASYAITDDEIVQNQNRLDVEARKIWNDWYGEKQFHQEPLYPYFLATVYSIFGHKPFLVFIIQALISMASLWLLVFLSKDLFDKKTALFSGGLYAFFGPAVFYDGILLRASLITFSTLLLLYWAHKMIQGKTRFSPWVFGAAMGLNLLFKFSSVILILFLIGYIMYTFRSEKKKVTIRLGQALATCLLIISPLLIRNVIVGAPIFSFSSVGAITYINSNLPSYDAYSGFTIDFEESARIMQASEGSLLRSIPLCIQTFDSPIGFFGLQLRKLATLFHNYEIPNNFNFYHFQMESVWLDIAFVRFYMIFGLGLLGMIIYGKKNRKTNVLHWSILAQMIVLVGFYVISRFKLPFTVCLIPFAAYGLVSILDWIQTKNYGQLKWLIIPIVGALTTVRPISEISTYLRPADITVQYKTEGLPRLTAASDNNDLPMIAAIYEEYVSKCPKTILKLNLANPPDTFREKELLKFYQGLFNGLEKLYEELGESANQAKMKNISDQMLQALNAAK